MFVCGENTCVLQAGYFLIVSVGERRCAMSHYSHRGDARYRKLHPGPLSSGKFRPGDLVQYVEVFRRKGHYEQYRVATCSADRVTFVEGAVRGKSFSPDYFELV